MGAILYVSADPYVPPAAPAPEPTPAPVIEAEHVEPAAPPLPRAQRRQSSMRVPVVPVDRTSE